MSLHSTADLFQHLSMFDDMCQGTLSGGYLLVATYHKHTSLLIGGAAGI